ncbi:hypothetical protein [Labrys sp. 22185]|uniref:hypothetical protein n=1 Tax=Labrys sp. 22185 TaxID=3453888 RepID=UPI003F87C842
MRKYVDLKALKFKVVKLTATAVTRGPAGGQEHEPPVWARYEVIPGGGGGD